MTDDTYSLPRFVDDLRAIAAENGDVMEIIRRVGPLAQRLATTPDWVEPAYYRCDEDQGFGVHLLHEEPDHTLAVFAVAWLPERGVGPHDHGTWAVVAGVDGHESNIAWRRIDDGSRAGYAEIEKTGERVIGRGDVVAMQPRDIHAVWNGSDSVSLSLHVYGKHINHTERQQFDPVSGKADPLIIAVE